MIALKCEHIFFYSSPYLKGSTPYSSLKNLANCLGDIPTRYATSLTVKHYYRGTYLDCVRAVDFLKSQAKVDANNIFAAGNTFNVYYDVLNFAEHVSCPCITSFSLQDTTAPPHTNVAPFNLLKSVDEADKEYIINPFLGHGTASDWGTKYMDFFKRYINDNLLTTDINHATLNKYNKEGARDFGETV